QGACDVRTLSPIELSQREECRRTEDRDVEHGLQLRYAPGLRALQQLGARLRVRGGLQRRQVPGGEQTCQRWKGVLMALRDAIIGTEFDLECYLDTADPIDFK